MNRYWGSPASNSRIKAFRFRTSAGRLDVAVCGLCAALVLDKGEHQHERWHRTLHAGDRALDGADGLPTTPIPAVTSPDKPLIRPRHRRM